MLIVVDKWIIKVNKLLLDSLVLLQFFLFEFCLQTYYFESLENIELITIVTKEGLVETSVFNISLT